MAPAIYARYQDAASDLIERLGDFCSYCERQIETHLAIEHVQPKSHEAALARAWANFLLGCVHCNSSKGDTPINLEHYLWPDSDNTLRAFEYGDGGLVEANGALAGVLRAKAERTITLMGLDKHPGNAGRQPSDSDRRWRRRFEAWQLAEKARNVLAGNDTPRIREFIVETALGRGMFSVWWTVFSGDVDMRRRLRQGFVGTDAGSFDDNEDVQPRPGGQV